MPTADARPLLTARQRRLLAYIVSHIRDHQRPPVLREMMAHFRWKSPQGAIHHLKALEKKGFLRKTPWLTRAYEVVDLAGPIRAAAAEYLEAIRGLEVKG